MKNIANAKNNVNGRNNRTNGFIPSSLKFISSCIKTASSGVRSASASVAASISADSNDHKDQVLWASFDNLQLGPSSFQHVLLLGYSNGFQVLNVDDGSNVSEIVSRRDDPVTFLQMQPLPAKSDCAEGFRASHPLLLVVACDGSKVPVPIQNSRSGLGGDGHAGPQTLSPTAVRFYSLRSHNYVHVLRFRSTVYMVRCSPQIVAIGLAAQIYCFDALTLENKFSVLTHPVPHLGGQGLTGVNVGYGPMAVGPRWLAYASNNPLSSNTGRLSPQSLTPPGVSPSTSPSSGSLVARYARESSRQFAAGLINLGDKGYKTLSKYYQEHVPDGSGSPVSSHSSRIVGSGGAHGAEIDVAGTVVVKDFVSKAVISQFRAHTSPISALSFDPSGTLLVTASVHGNNINVFRIMPLCLQNGSGNQSYDWSSSHVHLYKLHRGVTSAVIQDICFSHFSQWVAIVSSKGTCHIFALSPFGGENVLQVQNSQVDGPTLVPVLSLPWWFTSSFTVKQHAFCSTPPSATSLSVVSRIKNSNSGWLNIVSNAASSAAGKVSIPSGAISAVFHSCVPYDHQSTHTSALEHLLVYTPSGHVLQYKLLPSFKAESGESVLTPALSSSGQIQDEELRVRVEAVQWWDVCRRTDWPEREDYVSGITSGKQDNSYLDSDDAYMVHKESVKHHEKSQFYLCNAEVQMSCGRIPIWQKSKMYCYTMNARGPDAEKFNVHGSGGEIEIEKFPVNEVELRRKDLFPVFDHCQRVKADWSNRGLSGVGYAISSCDFHGASEKLSDNSLGSQSKLSPDPVKHSDVEDSHPPTIAPGASLTSRRFIAKGPGSSNSGGNSDVSNTSSNRSDLSMNVCDEAPVLDSVDFEQYFQEGYCRPQDPDQYPEAKPVADVESNCSPCDRNKSNEDATGDDDMLGCVFAFSQEG